MIQGFATREGTSAFAAEHSGIAFSNLGNTGLTVSPAGFGCYRVSAGVSSHHQAMIKAVAGGINLIDTSTNYADGESERLVGLVVEELVGGNGLRRDQVVVVSKAGYLQGRNFALSQERKQQGKGFEELVPYGPELEHCIHPDFLEDQLTRSLERLNLATLDVLLLHNPEYYLGWAHKQGLDTTSSREEYYHRIRKAFTFLETEVRRGRIRWYGISSNTFPAPADDPEFTSLDMLLQLAVALPDEHHFAVIQMPMNLLETGAALNPNQPDGRTVLELAHQHDLGVLLNRPLNALTGNQLLRLADISFEKQFTHDDIIKAIAGFKKSEAGFIHRFLPLLNGPTPLMQRISEQLSVADQLKHYWRNFGNYDRWRQVRSGFFLPRVQGVLQYLEQQKEQVEGLGQWMAEHEGMLTQVLDAVESMYSSEVKQQLRTLRQGIASADAEWAEGGTLSRMAVRALRSTLGVSSVLVGMRHVDYVADILSELHRPIQRKGRKGAWRHLHYSSNRSMPKQRGK